MTTSSSKQTLQSTMSQHTSSVFNNNCVKIPRHPKLDQPSPIYEQDLPYHLENGIGKLNLNCDMPEKKKYVDKETTREFLDFINKIPEYDDVNHLSNKEFYQKLEKLKEKQKLYEEYLRNEIKFDAKDSEWIEDYKNMKLNGKIPKNKQKKSNPKPFCITPILTKSKTPASDILDEDLTMFKPPSRRSVRIETPSEKFTPEPKSKSGAQTDWEDFSMEDLNLSSERIESKSAPNSPTKSKSDGITIPKPFQMTVRDEENKIVEELFLKLKKPKEEKSEQFKAHDIPIESQIPLFDKIMEDQRRRSFITKENRKAALQAQMKPFSFTKRDEEIQELTKQLSQSSPSLLEPPLRIKTFRAKPVPRNLFSNYIYRKMHEDEYYRALQKKIRAEELLRASSLPPSMAKREKTKPKMNVCPRSYRDCSEDEKPKRKSKKTIPDYKNYHERLEKELEELKNEFISTSPRPFRFKTSKRAMKSCRNSSAGSKSSSCKTPSSFSTDFPYLNRSNLAAVLRIQSARQKLEMEMMKKLEEAKLKEEARWREKLMRKKPVWQTLAYSHEEDLAMRLQLRRDEERLRNEEHRMRMQMMLGRVNQQPTLFERQSQANCPTTRDELVKHLCMEYGVPKRKSKKSSRNEFIEVKDEAVQALLDEIEKSDLSKESGSYEEEKEKCDSSSDDDNS